MTERERERKSMKAEAERRAISERVKRYRSAGYSNAEIAKLLGKSESTIRSLLGTND